MTAYLVWNHDDPDEKREIDTCFADTAAAEFVEQQDTERCGDYDIAGIEEVSVAEVANPSVVTRYTVRREADVSYYAYEVEP